MCFIPVRSRYLHLVIRNNLWKLKSHEIKRWKSCGGGEEGGDEGGDEGGEEGDEGSNEGCDEGGDEGSDDRWFYDVGGVLVTDRHTN